MEDNDINRQVALEMLDQMGVIVDIAVDGRAAVQALRAERFDLVLMDIQMPVMDGFEATRHIRASSDGGSPATIPIVAMTAHAMSGDREKSLAAGMDDHVTKPIDPATLLSVLVKWISPSDRGVLPADPPCRTRRPRRADHAPPGRPVIEEMPGISVAGALARVGGNEALYRSLLKKFYQENKAIAARIKNALKDRDRQSARRMIHTLKGVAGNIGAAALYEASGRTGIGAERRGPGEDRGAAQPIRVGAGDGDLHPRDGGGFDRPGRRRRPPDGMPLAAGDMAALRGLLSEMRPHLLKGKPIPLKRIMAEINTRTWPDAVNSGVATIGRLVDKYRFREAAAVVERLLASAEAESSR